MSVEERTRNIEKLYQELEIKILKDIAKSLKEHTPTGESGDIVHWKVKNLEQFRVITKKQKKIIAEYAEKTEKEVTKLIKELGLKQVEETQKQIDPYIQEDIFNYIPPDNFIYETLATLSVMNLEKFNMINSKVFYHVGDVYTDIITKASVEAMTGNVTIHQAMVNAVREVTRKGIPALITSDNRRLSLEGHIPTVLRAVRKNVIVDVESKMFDEYDIDLVEISSHLGSRPSHAPFQGRIFSRSGKSNKYPPLSITGYGAIDGLITGINCRHHMYPFVEGVSVKRYEPYDIKENTKAYKEQQQQRSLERAIRQAKKEKEVMMSAGASDKDIQKANELIRKRQKAMRLFIKKTGRTRNRERERIVK